MTRFLRTPWRSRSAARAVDSASLATGVALVRALAAFDAETAEHSAAVALYARDVALQLGADSDSAAGIQLGALVHDVGKLSLPAELLLKAGPARRRRSGRSCASTRRRVPASSAACPRATPCSTIVRHHHERVDGGGYPAGLRGSEIPAAARIVGACDAYTAMTQPRPYRASLAPDDAIVELRRNADAQFDSEVVEALVTLLDSRDDDYRLARTGAFSAESQHAELAECTEAPRHAAAS